MKNCPNCGAPIETAKCPYCGTLFIDFGATLSKRLLRSTVEDWRTTIHPEAVSIGQIVDRADKLMQNGILSSNEVRGLIGFMPVDDFISDI